MWAIITARVRSESAASRSAGSGLAVPGSTSMKTGTAPYCTIGATVVGKPQAAVITSSPRRIRRSPSSGLVSAVKASRLAEEPELTSSANRTPRYAASFCSKARENLP